MFEILLYSFMFQLIPLKDKHVSIFIHYAINRDYFRFWNIRRYMVKICEQNIYVKSGRVMPPALLFFLRIALASLGLFYKF